MALIVKKFGGSSVADTPKLKAVAEIVQTALVQGNKVLVVISAQGDTTDALEDKVKEICGQATTDAAKRERDAILATGEQVSAGLLALALQDVGVPAMSLCGWQVPIITNNVHGGAKVMTIDTGYLNELLHKGITPVITGFQGVCERQVMTLGRGGSDTTAAAVASAMQADQCLIYTDVDGIYSADPRKISQAKVINDISYDAALELAVSGGGVIHPRAVEIGMRHDFTFKILNTWSPWQQGTEIKHNTQVEAEEIVAVSADNNQSLIMLERIENVPGVLAGIFSRLQEINICADLIVQNLARDGSFCDLSFTVADAEVEATLAALEQVRKVAFAKLSVKGQMAKISIIGTGLKRYSYIAKKMFQTLAKQGINILLVATSEVKISVLIQRDFSNIALKTLHKEFIG